MVFLSRNPNSVMILKSCEVTITCVRAIPSFLIKHPSTVNTHHDLSMTLYIMDRWALVWRKFKQFSVQSPISLSCERP